jgi:hypothetical protein
MTMYAMFYFITNVSPSSNFFGSTVIQFHFSKLKSFYKMRRRKRLVRKQNKADKRIMGSLILRVAGDQNF